MSGALGALGPAEAHAGCLERARETLKRCWEGEVPREELHRAATDLDDAAGYLDSLHLAHPYSQAVDICRQCAKAVQTAIEAHPVEGDSGGTE